MFWEVILIGCVIYVLSDIGAQLKAELKNIQLELLKVQQEIRRAGS